MKRLLWLYLRCWRDRYGPEMVDLLAASQRPWRDGVNTVVYATLVWLEVPAFRMIVAAVSLMLFGFTVGQLADGVREIPHHWWSSASAALAVLAVATAVLSLTHSRRTDDA